MEPRKLLHPPRLLGRTGVLLILSTCAAVAQSDDQRMWRYWTVKDGLTETYSLRLSVAQDGTTIVRHGSVRSMSVLDGYSVAQLPEPRYDIRPNYQATARAYKSPDGSLWTTSDGMLKQYTGGQWVVHYGARLGLTFSSEDDSGGPGRAAHPRPDAGQPGRIRSCIARLADR